MIAHYSSNDLKALSSALERTGKKAQKIVSKAAGKGTTIVRRHIRPKIPIGETGELRKGIIRKAERSRKKGKKVYDLMFDPKKNDIFQKPVKNPGEAGSKNTKNGHAYYPKSVDAGFITRDKGWVPGYHFMANGAEEGYLGARKTVIDTAMNEIEKELAK
ncbi:MAG: HK97 gp10 family phage protein [Oscillospiraceae bacterium]|nr:HK97 gp10 family phage protein [Oscillospiraceae bacterium]